MQCCRMTLTVMLAISAPARMFRMMSGRALVSDEKYLDLKRQLAEQCNNGKAVSGESMQTVCNALQRGKRDRRKNPTTDRPRGPGAWMNPQAMELQFYEDLVNYCLKGIQLGRLTWDSLCRNALQAWSDTVGADLALKINEGVRSSDNAHGSHGQVSPGSWTNPQAMELQFYHDWVNYCIESIASGERTWDSFCISGVQAFFDLGDIGPAEESEVVSLGNDAQGSRG
uniref:Uncharacterized protein n=1 Tax=Romanomermis culicivorax TaxID=13658 RepID=A0A915KQD3_ROMCU